MAAVTKGPTEGRNPNIKQNSKTRYKIGTRLKMRQGENS